MPIYGIPYRISISYSKTRSLANCRNRGILLQRLFSTFPGGRPGLGLLLLRAVVGPSAIAEGIFYLTGPSSLSVATWLLGFLLMLAGIGLTIGFLTPLASLLAGIYFFGVVVSWFPVPSLNIHDFRLIAVGLIATTMAIALIGPGAFSLDGYLFGRREIVIPPSSGHKEP